MWDLILPSLVAGLGVALLTGFMGCFVVWRRLAYFGDALSHGTLLGLALALSVSLDADLVIVASCFVFSCALMALERQGRLNSDSYLGILAHSGLAFGIVAVSLTRSRGIDLETYLLGDLLLVDGADIARIYTVAAIANLCLIFFWQPLLRLTLNSELAKVEGVNQTWTGLVFFFVLSMGVGMSMRVIGALLINAMLIVPPSCASLISRSPVQMAVFSVLLGMLSTALGIFASFYFDLPSSPAIVGCMALIFIALILAKASIPLFQRFSPESPNPRR